MSNHCAANRTAFQDNSFNYERMFFEAAKALYLAIIANHQQPTPIVQTEFYTSASHGVLPPGCESKRQFMERCRSGDLRNIAHKDGQVWFVRCADYFAHLQREREQSSRAKAPALNDIVADERIKRSIDEACKRPSRKRVSR